MESDRHSRTPRAPKHIHSFFGISLVAVVATLAGILALSASDELAEQFAENVLVHNEASILSTEDNTQTQSNNSKRGQDPMWDTLKATGLQGDYYTLNIEGRDDAVMWEDCTVLAHPTTGAYGDTVYVPRNGTFSQNNQITYVTNNPDDKYTRTPGAGLEVHDACTAPFDGDGAEISLPKNEKGYYVVTRVIGKPTNNPELTINGHMQFIEDEYGSEFLVLGIITNTGFQTPIQISAQTVSASVATDISGLFEWSGRVCYANETSYCTNESDNTMCTREQLCCVDTNEDELIDSCIDSTRNFDGTRSCTTGKPVVLSCREYVNESLFSIDEFVQYFWSVDEEKNFKEARILFYPVR